MCALLLSGRVDPVLALASPLGVLAAAERTQVGTFAEQRAAIAGFWRLADAPDAQASARHSKPTAPQAVASSSLRLQRLPPAAAPPAAPRPSRLKSRAAHLPFPTS
eukprot:4307445-Prymnesium_polylepis.1